MKSEVKGTVTSKRLGNTDPEYEKSVNKQKCFNAI